jgi:hypothetical protein
MRIRTTRQQQPLGLGSSMAASMAAVAAAGAIVIVLLPGRSLGFMLPSSSPPPSPLADTPWRLRLPLAASSLQLLALSALGPLSALIAAPPAPAMAALDLATVSKLQGPSLRHC